MASSHSSPHTNKKKIWEKSKVFIYGRKALEAPLTVRQPSSNEYPLFWPSVWVISQGNTRMFLMPLCYSQVMFNK